MSGTTPSVRGLETYQSHLCIYTCQHHHQPHVPLPLHIYDQYFAPGPPTTKALGDRARHADIPNRNGADHPTMSTTHAKHEEPTPQDAASAGGRPQHENNPTATLTMPTSDAQTTTTVEAPTTTRPGTTQSRLPSPTIITPSPSQSSPLLTPQSSSPPPLGRRPPPHKLSIDNLVGFRDMDLKKDVIDRKDIPKPTPSETDEAPAQDEQERIARRAAITARLQYTADKVATAAVATQDQYTTTTLPSLPQPQVKVKVSMLPYPCERCQQRQEDEQARLLEGGPGALRPSEGMDLFDFRFLVGGGGVID